MRHGIVEHVSRRTFYGWVILWVAGAGIFASGPGQSHTFSVFIGPISQDLGIGATEITSAYGLATLIAAFGLPMMGRLVDRNGVVMMMLVVITLLGFMCIFFGLVPSLIWLGVGFCGVRFLAQGSLMLNCANVISHWFSRKRGFAMGVMLLGFAVSMAIHPVASQWLIDNVGWRKAWFWLGVSTWGLMLPLVVLLLHNAPEALGLRSDGAAADEPETAVDQRHSADFGLTLAQALRTPTFYIVASGLFTMSMLITTLHFFQVSIFEHQGLSPNIAAGMFALSALVAVVSQPIFGRGLDRLPTHRMFGVALFVLCGSLFSVTFVCDLPTAILYGVIFGINNAISMTLFGYLWPRYFGRKHLGSIQGTGQMIGVVGASIGPLPLGIAFDLFGNYNQMLYILAVIPIFVAIPTQFLKEPNIAGPEDTV
ncbi:MAG: MFS transporter [Rhodospirillaceae bacterium]|nr:MFS transporter [Rhodospirillaceae bacterium]